MGSESLRLVPAKDGQRRLDLVSRLAAAQRSTGDLEAARTSLLTALELIADGDRSASLRLTAACAASEHFLGRHEAAQLRLGAAFDALPRALLAPRCRGVDEAVDRRLLHDGNRADVRLRLIAQVGAER
jgi:hypothetical protein